MEQLTKQYERLGTFTVQAIDHKIAKGFTEKHHNTHEYRSSVLTLGITHDDNLIDVECFGIGPYPNFGKVNSKKLYQNNEVWFWRRGCNVPDAPLNTAAISISLSIKYVKKYYPHVKMLVSWVNATHGEVGSALQTTNFVYVGESSISKDGSILHRFIYPLDKRTKAELLKRWSSEVKPYPKKITFREHTPIEEYKLDDRTIFVKREDMYATLPKMPPLSKLRGIKVVIGRLHDNGTTLVGNFDTRVSYSGQGVASICYYLYPTMKSVLGYPRLKGHDEIPPQLEIAKSLGAEIIPIPASRLAINYYQMKRKVEDMGGVMLPHGLPFIETAKSVAEEVATIPDELLTGTLVICSGTGTILGGIAAGLRNFPDIISISAGKTTREQSGRVASTVFELNPGNSQRLHKIKFLSPIMDYYQECTVDVPFSSHRNYDAKAWLWLSEHVKELKSPILFWNIGGN